MKLIYNSEYYHNLKGGENIISEGGFPNLIKIDNNKEKIKYEYNIDKYIENEKINIQNILQKRKEEIKPLINFNDDIDNVNLVKKKEEYTTNINIKDLY